MGMVVVPQPKLMLGHPRASKHIDRDTAVRWRAVPADKCQLVGDQIYVPRQFMLMSENEQQALLFGLQSRVEKLEGILGSLGHGVAPSATVLPMRSNVERTEQSRVESVPGNEAEELYPQPTEPDPAPSSVPSATLAEASKPSGRVVQLPDKAANDEVIEAKPHLVTGESTTLDTSLVRMDLKPFGFTVDEASAILKAEHGIRDAHCIRTHNGVSFIDLRLLRAFAKDGTVTDRYHKSEYSKYAQFWARTAEVTRVPDYDNLELQHKYATNDNMWYDWVQCKKTAPKADRKREKRRVLRLKLDMRARRSSAHFEKCVKYAIMGTEAHEPSIPFSWKAARRAMSTRYADRWDVIRGWFGRPPRDRSRKAREQIAEYDASQDVNVPMNELVRRYQRQGISPV